LAFSFAMSQGATALVPPGNEELFWMAVDIAGQIQPMTRASEQKLRQLSVEARPLFRYSSIEKEG